MKSQKSKTVLQVVSMPKAHSIKKLNGEDQSGGTFETRFIPRYKKMPPLPFGLPQPTFSESSSRILHERYLLKGGNLEVVETVSERFWHIAYDIASGDFDFGAKAKNVMDQAINFYEMMVKQEFLPNSPTIMNAGKQNGLQYSACFVLPVGDSLSEIFDAIKFAALIHQTGGGCISADARVWTTFCGIEPIETLFSRATADSRRGIRKGSGVAYDVSDLGIKTVSMNPTTGETGLKRVTHVWKYEVPSDQQIIVTTVEGTVVQTSNWHPFMVVREAKIVEVPAEKLQKGDVVFGLGQADKYWPFNKFHQIGDLVIDQGIGWLVGFTLGDGSFGYVPTLRQYRVRWFSGTEDVLQKVQTILAKFNIHVSIQKDKRGLLSITTLNQKFVYDLLEACGLEKFGPKDNRIRVPEIIVKSPISAVKAFLAGLLDSDGYVALDGSPSYSTVSESMAEDLAALISLLGYRPTIKVKAPYGRGRQITYSIQICPLPQVNDLACEIGPYLANSLRTKRLKSSSRKQTALPLNFRAFRDALAKLGMVKKRFDKSGGHGPLAYELNYWSAHGRIDRDSLHSIAKKIAVKAPNLAQLLQRIADGGHEIKSVEQASIAKPYYDLSVEEWNTYAAGQSGMVMIHNTGFAFSRLRSQGAPVKTTGGVASGPVSFLRVFNAATESIKQGGTRRGANMGILRIDHPDILEFIRCKSELDEYNQSFYDAVAPALPDDAARQAFKRQLLDKQIANFNISCAVTDKFMEAYYKDEDYELIDPHTKEVVGKLSARAVFDEIIDRAWQTGDPGLVFIDRINKSPANPVPQLEEIEATNPSLRAGTKVLTKEGIFPIESLNGKRFYVKNLDGQWSLAECFISGRNKVLYKITFDNNSEVYATAEHKWPVMLVGGGVGKVTTNQLRAGNLLPFPKVEDIQFESKENFSREQGFMLGWLYGDGWITQRGNGGSNSISYSRSGLDYTSNLVKSVMAQQGVAMMSYPQPGDYSLAVNEDKKDHYLDMCFGFLFSREDKLLAKIILQEVNKLKKKSSRLLSAGDNTYTIQITSSVFTRSLVELFGVNKKDQGLPLSVWQSGSEFIKGFIDGLFSSDGFVSKKIRRIVFTTKHKKLAEDVSDLLSFYGIKSTVRYAETKLVSFPNGKSYHKTYGRYDVSINGYHAVDFAKIFSLSHSRKQENLTRMINEYFPTRKEADAGISRVISVEQTELKEDVWDISVYDDTHCFYINHCVTGNCGEQPLASWDACNLGSINLGKFVLEDGSDVDWERLRDTTHKAVHFLDNVVQVNPYTLPQIYEEVHKNRRIGLGVMGWADMLFKLKIPYNSKAAIELGEKVMKFINEEGHKMSGELATIRGPFPNWPYSIYKNRYKNRKPLRNSTVTTIAPTGTISIIGDCSSGIEPVFALAYIHQVKRPGLPTRVLTIANKTFEGIAKREGFYSDDLAQKVMEKGTVQGLKEVPENWQKVFITAPEIDPEIHVKMQAAFQKYTDNGVSKTINLPNSASPQDVATAYLAAWETGCLGITIYRDGSKHTQVLNVSSALKQKTEGVEETSAPVASRPMILRGRTYKIATPVGEAYITINRDEADQPFEVFVTVGKGGMHTMADAEAMGRLVSLSLRLSRSDRASIPKEVAQKIVSQLKGIGGASSVGFGKNRVLSLADAIAKVLAEDLALAPQEETAEAIPLNLTINGNGQANGELVESSINPTSDIRSAEGSLQNRPTSGSVDLCPDCGSPSYVWEEGCQKCHSCGYSIC